MSLNTMKYKGLVFGFLCAINSVTAMAVSPSANKASCSRSPSITCPPAMSLKKGHAIIQGGVFWSSFGKPQHINIGDSTTYDFTINHRQTFNGIVGWGYFIDGKSKSAYSLSYGVNAFYLPQTSIKGAVLQDGGFTNVYYKYNQADLPVYAITKGTIGLDSDNYELTIDAGLGPNFMFITGYQEQSLDTGITSSVHISSGATHTNFSATTGIGLKMNHVLGELPVECGYRFFYLGQGGFSVPTNQDSTRLNTGRVYANAIMCSIII